MPLKRLKGLSNEDRRAVKNVAPADSASTSSTRARTRKKPARSVALQEALARRAFKKWKVRRNVYRRLAVRVGNGATVEDVLEIEAQSMEEDGDDAAYVLRDASRLMRNGKSLAEALRRWVPNDEMGVLATSEESDALPENLEYFIETRRRMTRVTTAFRNACVQPVIYLATIYSVLLSIAKYSIPKLQASGTADHATGFGRLLLTASSYVNSWVGLIPPAIFIVLIFIVTRSMSNWTGPVRVVAERYFPYSFYRDSQGFVWLSGYLSMFKAGRSDIEILAMQAKYASPWLRERLLHYRRMMVNGKSLAAALATPISTGRQPFAFPNKSIINDIKAMGETELFAEKMRVVLSTWANELEEETLEKSKIFGFAFEVAMYIMMGVLMVGMKSLVTQIATTH